MLSRRPISASQAADASSPHHRASPTPAARIQASGSVPVLARPHPELLASTPCFPSTAPSQPLPASQTPIHGLPHGLPAAWFHGLKQTPLASFCPHGPATGSIPAASGPCISTATFPLSLSLSLSVPRAQAKRHLSSLSLSLPSDLPHAPPPPFLSLFPTYYYLIAWLRTRDNDTFSPSLLYSPRQRIARTRKQPKDGRTKDLDGSERKPRRRTSHFLPSQEERCSAATSAESSFLLATSSPKLPAGHGSR